MLSLLVLPPGKELVAIEALGVLPKGIVTILCWSTMGIYEMKLHTMYSHNTKIWFINVVDNVN